MFGCTKIGRCGQRSLREASDGSCGDQVAAGSGGERDANTSAT